MEFSNKKHLVSDSNNWKIAIMIHDRRKAWQGALLSNLCHCYACQCDMAFRGLSTDAKQAVF